MSTSPAATPFLGLMSPAIQARNALADRLFYDVGGLTEAEQQMLMAQTNIEGAILIVEPRADTAAIRVHKFDTFDAFRREPGNLLRHFTVAGVGSSDLGAAALARTLANHLDAPVGAIVAGYGLSDLLSEALGGWFFFGSINRAIGRIHQVQNQFDWPAQDSKREHDGAVGTALEGVHSPDTQTLIRLLGEKERQIETMLGHSKGCLSIAYALRALALRRDKADFRRATDIDIFTTGAVVALPTGLNRLRQYLGNLDWFGGMNSSLHLEHVSVPGAWHHMNTEINFHMDLAAVLDGRYDQP